MLGPNGCPQRSQPIIAWRSSAFLCNFALNSGLEVHIDPRIREKVTSSTCTCGLFRVNWHISYSPHLKYRAPRSLSRGETWQDDLKHHSHAFRSLLVWKVPQQWPTWTYTRRRRGRLLPGLKPPAVSDKRREATNCFLRTIISITTPPHQYNPINIV